MKETTETARAVTRITKDAVTREDLRAMEVGQEIEFVLPARKQFESARSAAWQMRFEHRRFSTENVGDLEHDVWAILIKRIE